MPLKQKVSVDEVMQWKPCRAWGKSRVRKMDKKGTGKTPLELARMSKVPGQHRLWLLLRPEIIPERALRLLVCDYAEMLLEKHAKKHDARSQAAVDVARKYIDGSATDAERARAYEEALACRRGLKKHDDFAALVAALSAAPTIDEVTSVVRGVNVDDMKSLVFSGFKVNPSLVRWLVSRMIETLEALE
jgi:hypothetical protein